MTGNNNKHIENDISVCHTIRWMFIMICLFDRRVIMANVINDDKWINIDEAAEYLGVKPGTIRDWIRKEKGIPAHKIGKQWKFKRSELDDWVNSGKSAIN